MGRSHITLATRGNTVRISRERMNYLMAADDNHCVFSAREKFTDFWRRIFSGKSNLVNYKHTHQLFCFDNPKSLWDETIESHWRPLCRADENDGSQYDGTSTILPYRLAK